MELTMYLRFPETGEVDTPDAFAVHRLVPTQAGSVSGADGGTFLVVVAVPTVQVAAGIRTSTVPGPQMVTMSIRGVVTVAGQLVPIVQVVYPAPFQYESVPVAAAAGFDPPTPDSAEAESLKFVTWTSDPFQPAGAGRLAGKPPTVKAPMERIVSAWMHPSPEVPTQVPEIGRASCRERE